MKIYEYYQKERIVFEDYSRVQERLHLCAEGNTIVFMTNEAYSSMSSEDRKDIDKLHDDGYTPMEMVTMDILVVLYDEGEIDIDEFVQLVEKFKYNYGININHNYYIVMKGV